MNARDQRVRSESIAATAGMQLAAGLLEGAAGYRRPPRRREHADAAVEGHGEAVQRAGRGVEGRQAGALGAVGDLEVTAGEEPVAGDRERVTGPSVPAAKPAEVAPVAASIAARCSAGVRGALVNLPPATSRPPLKPSP